MATRNTNVCLLTGFPVELVNTKDRSGFEYYLKTDSGEYYFNISEWFNPESSIVVQTKSHIIKGLILNGFWPKRLNIISDVEILETINNYSYPILPQQKLDNLFEFLFKMQTRDGDLIELKEFWNNEFSVYQLYFQDEDECMFYVKTLIEKGLIIGEFFPWEEQAHLLWTLEITFKGLEYYLKLTNEGQKSKRCFIAMNFDDNMQETRLAIKSACINTGFEPILIDEIHYDADTTINDAIIAELKKSKFCISDFTGQKDGVYFEAGFALGRGLKVIYSVHKDDLKNSHFDTKHFPHITYETTKELVEKLINKIEAWIKD